jgi:DhnA family fructose-bisphosphate aldolase class Ia
MSEERRDMKKAVYSIHDYSFDLEYFFPKSMYEKITEIRVNTPEVIEQRAKARAQRKRLTRDGKLTILAADHPGRGVTALGGDPFRMANRYEYLGRILRVLTGTDFDGFMSTPDMVEDLLILDYLVQEGGGQSFLDEKILVGCMQRGGVAGVVGEIDDRFGSYTAESIKRFRLDGGKLMFRFVPDDERTLWTIDYCTRAINELNRYELVPFVEPLRMDYRDGKWINKNTAEELIKLVGVIGAMGDSSRNTWMKLPYCDGYERVTLATTQPILLLGGSSNENPTQTYYDFAAGMAARSNVRGALVGRNVSFPGPEDPAAVANAIYAIVHGGISGDEAIELTIAQRGTKMDLLRDTVR